MKVQHKVHLIGGDEVEARWMSVMDTYAEQGWRLFSVHPVVANDGFWRAVSWVMVRECP